MIPLHIFDSLYAPKFLTFLIERQSQEIAKVSLKKNMCCGILEEIELIMKRIG